MTGESGGDAGRASAGDGITCGESDCGRPAGVRLHVPRAENRLVCVPHARVLARRDGVVAEPLEDAEWP